MDSTPLEHLAQINVEDLLTAFGLQKESLSGRAAAWLFRSPGRRFARVVLDYDDGVARLGLKGGAQRILERLQMQLTVSGQEHIPPAGPILILSNHPGLADTVALFAGLPREDIAIVAADRPFLRALPATCRRLIFVPEGNGRLETLRAIAAHLRAGKGILTFPAGQIEPDPACMPGSAASLENWSESIGFFARMVPGMCILPVVVSGVIAAPTLRHPLTRLRRTQKDRERLAAALQLLAATYRPQTWPVHIQVRFTAPIPAEYLSGLADAAAVTRRVIDYTRSFYPVA